MDDTIRRDMI